MAAVGVFLCVAKEALASVRNTTLFVIPVSTQSSTQTALQFELLTETEALAESAPTDGGDEPEETPAPAGSKRISALQFFQPEGSTFFSLLVLANERRLVHYEVDVAGKSLHFRSARSLPRNANGLALARVQVGDERKYVVLVSEKTGEAVAMPFPDIARDLKTLLGHTTSMITHMAVNVDSSLLITGDRDEKIRVSRFPQTAIVESYCLGHKAAITRVGCSVVTPDLLVTTSLDNTLKLWSISTGKLLDSQTLLTTSEIESDDKSLLTASLAVSPVANVAVALIDNRYLRVFEIVSQEGEDAKLKPLTVAADRISGVTAGQPCDLVFAEDGKLVVAYKNAPFVQVFDVQIGADIEFAASIPADNATYSEFRQAAAKIELVRAEAEALDELEDELKKKKVRTDWKPRMHVSK